MKLHWYFHNYAPETVCEGTREAVGVLERVCAQLPYLVWPAKALKPGEEAKLSKNKLRERKFRECLQSLNNIWLRQALQEEGFQAECPVRDSAVSSDEQRVDFARLLADGRRVLVEVEFGYTASLERNFFKLQDAYHHGRSALGVMICPVASLAKRIASGVATFETARERLLSFHPLTMPVPLVLIGLDRVDTPRIDLSSSALKGLGPECLSGNTAERMLWHVARELRAGVLVEQLQLPKAEDHLRLKREVRAVSHVNERQSSLFF